MPEKSSRRFFLAGLSALAGTASAMVAAFHRPFRAEASVEPRTSPGNEQALTLDPRPAVLPATYPRWTYLPPGFVLTSTSQDNPGGLEVPGEISQFFHSSGRYGRSGHYAFLAIYIAPFTTKQSFQVVERVPEIVTVTMRDGETNQIAYYDGVWQPTQLANPPADRSRVSNGETLIWGTQNLHAVQFSLGGYSVFILGCRYADIDREDLLKIAASFTAQVR
jgi:hypothetical protein